MVRPYPEALQEPHYLPSAASKAAGPISLSAHHHLHHTHIYVTVMLSQHALLTILKKSRFHITKVVENVLTFYNMKFM